MLAGTGGKCFAHYTQPHSPAFQQALLVNSPPFPCSTILIFSTACINIFHDTGIKSAKVKTKGLRFRCSRMDAMQEMLLQSSESVWEWRWNPSGEGKIPTKSEAGRSWFLSSIYHINKKQENSKEKRCCVFVRKAEVLGWFSGWGWVEGAQISPLSQERWRSSYMFVHAGVQPYNKNETVSKSGLAEFNRKKHKIAVRT